MLIDNITLNLTRHSIGAEFIGTHIQTHSSSVEKYSEFRSNAKHLTAIRVTRKRERDEERKSDVTSALQLTHMYEPSHLAPVYTS